MARHLTWCLRSTFLLANRLSVNRQSILKYCNVFSPKIFPKINKINVDYDEPKEFKVFRQESKSGFYASITTLMKILSISQTRAKNAIDEYPAFRNLPIKMIIDNFEILRESSVYKSTIKDNKFLLIDTTEDLKKKIIIIGKIGDDLNEFVNLFHLPLDALQRFETLLRIDARYLSGANRLQYLAKKLDCEISTICSLVIYRPFLLRMCAAKLMTITDLFLDSGIAPQYILSDITAYRYRISTIIQNLELAKRAHIEPLKPWVVRCPEDTWKEFEDKQGHRENILKPKQTIPEYLCEVFECDLNLAEHLILKNPKLLKMDIRKFTSMANLLHNEGYKIDEILRSPHIFHRRLETIKEFLDIWKESGAPRPALFRFLLDKEKFKKSLAQNNPNLNPDA